MDSILDMFRGVFMWRYPVDSWIYKISGLDNDLGVNII